MKKNSIFIELTPLLDVILILLFLILVQSAGRVDAFYEETRQAFETQLDTFKAEHHHEMEYLRRVGADYSALRLGLEEDTGIVLVSIVSDSNDIDNRWILIEADSYVTQVDLCWNAVARDNSALELNTALAYKIQNAANSVMVIVFRYDSSSIFMSDHRLVANAIHIQRQFNQLVVAELDTNNQTGGMS
ncbi:MAG: hypothetical protein FWC92_00450 [Defluviitaleaceae bacterium]|nr:hypothetical protein [Defluviitaleaceae bacterium]